MSLTGSIVEGAALKWFGKLGCSCLGAEAVAPTISQGARASYCKVVLVGRLRDALRQLRPNIPDDAQIKALKNVLRTDFPSMVSTDTHQCRTLASLRDTLLPELLSGELALDAFCNPPL